jgi:hypothetical protein
MIETLLFLADFVNLLSRLYELCFEALHSDCARPITPRAAFRVAEWIDKLIRMTSLIQTAAAPHWLAGMVGVLPQVLPFFAALVAVVVLVVLLPRLRRVSLEALRIGPVSFGPIRFFFASPRPRAALPRQGRRCFLRALASARGLEPSDAQRRAARLRRRGLEPLRCYPLAPQSSASANSRALSPDSAARREAAVALGLRV